MNLLLFFIGFSKSIFVALLAALALSSCSDLLSGGSGTESSELGDACSGVGGLLPSPIGPESIPTFEKFSLSNKSTEISTQTKLVAVVDEVCALARSKEIPALTQPLLAQIRRQDSLSSNRAYPFQLAKARSTEELRVMVESDPCLLQLSEDVAVTLSATVNDARLNDQLHLKAINAETGWDTFHSGLSGEVVIAIIDDGIQLDHPDLQDVLWTNPGEIAGNGIDDDANGYVDDVNGYNFASSLPSPAHENGSYHGTHVAGLAGAEGNNSIGVTGVMGRHVKIMALNVFGPNASISSANIINALNYARNKGADVINMSLGGQGSSATVNTAMVNAVAAGAFIAVAAGNDGVLVTTNNFYMPMGYAKDISGAMAVGSTDATTGLRSSFSNYSHSFVEIGAPGSNAATGGVLSTYPTSTYQYLQGTSMASPVLAGSAALLIGWVRSRGASITPAQVEVLLKSSANTNAALSNYFESGAALNLANLAAVATCNF